MTEPKYVDLHVHSNASDGTCTPSEDVRLALKAGLKAFALTDHDTIKGYKEAKDELERLKAEDESIDMELIPGVELSASYMGGDIHILGLFIDPYDTKLNEKLNEAVLKREERNEKMVQKFVKIGINMTMDELLEGNPNTVITRAHFSRALINKGIVKNKDEAFEKYLNEDACCYVPREYVRPEAAIKMILEAGGIPIFAHPYNYRHIARSQVYELLEKVLVPAGLKGLEVIHSTNRQDDFDVLSSMAAHFGLMMSGGSDFHGENKPDIKIGIGRGNLRIPAKYYETLRRYKNEHES